MATYGETVSRIINTFKALSKDNKLYRRHVLKVLLDKTTFYISQKLQDKSTITFDDNIYWKEIDGKKEGPFCPTCFDVNELSVRLHKDGPGWWCKNCRDHFGESTKY